jgi:Flp pilus assembly protein TadG
MRQSPAHVVASLHPDAMRTRRARSRGVSIVEMALVLPILLMLSFGIVDYGYYFYVKSSIQGAAQSGARAAIVSGATNGNVTTAVSQVMTAAGLQSSGYTVTTSPVDISTAASGSTVTVTVACSWGTVGYHNLPTAMGGIPTSKQVTCSAAMRKE